jgi:Tol biopolymer transport system component
MRPEAWARVTATFHLAVEKPAAERAAFLAGACGDDAWLRQEVESLLASHEAAPGTAPFVDEVMEAVAARAEEALGPGRRVGRYEVEAPLGAGGMGAVYLAQDTSLGRKVALKVLPGRLAASPTAMRRFQQEARLASGLNHPNIVVVYEVGQEGPIPFIATELIEGETLRARIRSGGMDARDALPLAMQVASALAAAHQAGVVHRDIKPENVMMRPDGLVKVLDFGLAKPESRGEAPALTTAPGVVMGTVSYMSPEQARGLPVDARSDVWSFGVLLYEMLGGRLPFAGSTNADVIVAILEREPATLAGRVPAGLADLVRRCLAKDRLARYRSAGELLRDLQAVQAGGAAAPPSRALASRGRPRPGRRVVAAVAGGAVAAAILALAYPRPRESGPAGRLQMAQVTHTGNVASAAVSRDGTKVAYVMEESGQQSVWIRQMDGPGEDALAPAGPVHYRGLTFSADGRALYVVADLENDETFALYRQPLAGGPREEVMAGVDSAVGFSPDGSRLAFVRRPSLAETALVVANADGSGARSLLTRRAPARIVEVAPTWSPDGRTLAAVAVGGATGEGWHLEVVTIDLGSGAVRNLGDHRWRWAGAPAWLADGSAVLVPTATGTTTNGQLVRLSYPGGAAAEVTRDVNSYISVSATADPTSFIALRRELLSSVWTASLDGGAATKITRGEGEYFYNLSWTPDGRIVCASAESGTWDLWVLDPATRAARPLTSGTAIDAAPDVSPDGRYVLFQSNRGGSRNIWRIGVDGGDPVALTFGADEYNPQASPDGWVAYTSDDENEVTSWRVPIAGGRPVRLGRGSLRDPAVSPDGRLVAGHYQDRPGSPWRIAVLPAGSGGAEPVQTLDLPGAGAPWQVVRWIPKTNGWSYIESRDEAHNVWAWQPGRPPRPLTRFESGRIFSYAWSRDGTRLACIRGVHNRDVVHVRASRP